MKTKMRRSGIRLAGVLLLACLLAFAFASCGLGGGDETTASATTAAPATTAEPATTAPATTSAPETTAEPTTTAAPATTAEPATTSAPATTAEPTTTAEPATTAAPATTAEPFTFAEVTEPEIELGGVSPLNAAEAEKISLNPTGLSFFGTVDKDYFDALVNVYGANYVKVGMLIAPTDAVTGNVIDVAAAETVKVAAGEPALDGEVYRFTSVLTGIAVKDYSKKYSAVAYVEVGGEILRCSDYSEASDLGSFSEAAQAALNDLSDVQDRVTYKYSVTIGEETKYSPYTQRQRERLTEYSFANSFSVMCYNIEVYDSSKGWEGRNPAKALTTIISESPDIVGLQEVSIEWDEMIDNMAKNNGYTRVTGDFSTDNFESNEILFKTDKFTLITEGTKTFKTASVELNVPNDEGAQWSRDKHGRIFHYAVLEQIETGRRILIVNTHLHYVGTGSGFEEEDKVRRYEIRTLLAWLELQSETYPDQLVMGDMNSHYKGGQGAVNMALFTDAGFAMTSQVAQVVEDDGGTLTSNSRAGRDKWIFDYILVRGNIGTAYYSVVNNPVDNDKYPSDHIPVKASVCIR